MKLFVYGTLKKGEYNHKCLENSTYVDDAMLEGYTLYDTGYGYPAAVEKKSSRIMGEVYELSKEDYKYIRSMELGAGYSEIDLGDFIIYTYPKERIKHLCNAKEIGQRWGRKHNAKVF